MKSYSGQQTGPCPQIYKSHHPSSFDAINLFIFALGCLTHVSLYIVNVSFLGTSNHDLESHFDPIALALSCLLEASRDVSALYVIYCGCDLLHVRFMLRPLQITTSF
jgi:hypothetical protein